MLLCSDNLQLLYHLDPIPTRTQNSLRILILQSEIFNLKSQDASPLRLTSQGPGELSKHPPPSLLSNPSLRHSSSTNTSFTGYSWKLREHWRHMCTLHCVQNTTEAFSVLPLLHWETGGGGGGWNRCSRRPGAGGWLTCNMGSPGPFQEDSVKNCIKMTFSYYN